MTEAEWLVCGAPREVLAAVLTGAPDRKLRLFACACVRRAWHRLPDRRSRRAIKVTEQLADGLATLRHVSRAAAATEAVLED